eukprot:6743209-Prorocentrum_lima.AAC.1
MAGGKLGEVSIHSLLTKDNKYVPMLASMDFLRRSQAVIDFSSGVAVFRALSDKPVRLQRISTGHLVIDIIRDLYDQGGPPVTDAEAETVKSLSSLAAAGR